MAVIRSQWISVTVRLAPSQRMCKSDHNKASRSHHLYAVDHGVRVRTETRGGVCRRSFVGILGD